MGHRFCISCGAALPKDAHFCAECGEPVIQDTEEQHTGEPLTGAQDTEEPEAGEPVTRARQVVEHEASLLPDVPEEIPVPLSGGPGHAPVPPTVTPVAPKFPVKIIAAILIVFVIASAIGFVVLQRSTGQATAGTETSIPRPPTTPVVSATPTESPFPDALALRQKFLFGSGNTLSEGTVYRYWMNDTYQWHNDKDNHYYVEKPRAGNKFLAVFVDVVNVGNTRIWPPAAGNIHLIYDGKEYDLDPDHYLPDRTVNSRATPIEIWEIQYIPKMTGTEYVEDYGYSHGSELSYLYPGASNAIDGYLIYEVPESLTPDKTFVKIEFPGQEAGVWKLA